MFNIILGETGVIILVDYEEAFDSLCRGYISHTLSTFNFGVNSIKWVETLRKKDLTPV